MTQTALQPARTLSLSDLAPRAIQSEIRAMTMECDRMGGVNLAQGVCDTDVPAPVAEGAHQAIRDGHNIYTRLDGIQRLRNAIAAKLHADRGLSVDPDREILVASGATGAFHAAAMALLNPGDEVILFEPFYGYHANTLAALRVKPVIVPLAAPDWTLDLDALRRALTPRTRAMLINTPANPSGKIFNQNELSELGTIAAEHNLFLFTDEIYEYFLYGNARHISPAMLSGLRERTILMSGFSKTFAITGWRLGYLVADPQWLGAINYFHDLLYVCAPAPFQHGAAAGLEQLGPDFYRRLAADYQSRRDRLVAALSDAGLTPHIPAGAYYILADVSRLEGENAAKKARNLLARTGVAGVAGSAFFRPGGGENLLRFCFAKKDADLDDACQRLRKLD
ncbi:MAG TPA: pyridoxal phosphate-dependent aminotransferase [Acidobacteriaceae bacterium]|nr:pyridoxal phosphate-dependent aminotransferase [Acidobacteriaceae bacterium]